MLRMHNTIFEKIILCISLNKVFGVYGVTKVPSLYNIIIRLHAFNLLEDALSTLYLSTKYHLPNGHISMIHGDQVIARRCYKDNFRFIRVTMVVVFAPLLDING